MGRPRFQTKSERAEYERARASKLTPEQHAKRILTARAYLRDVWMGGAPTDYEAALLDTVEDVLDVLHRSYVGRQ